MDPRRRDAKDHDGGDAGEAVSFRGGTMMNARQSRLCASLFFAATAFAAQAAEVLKVIVPTPPGGGTDGYFRVLVKEAEPLLNETILINNVPGAAPRRSRRPRRAHC